ncbi:MAG: hypothetical protein JWM44_1976 [Bacilli bacterium]|nr:hypothetical protein [Bacilli bacterium]
MSHSKRAIYLAGNDEAQGSRLIEIARDGGLANAENHTISQ